MSRLRMALMVVLTLIAFAGNAILCRAALTQTAIDPSSFTLLRLVAGTAFLTLLAAHKRQGQRQHAHWAAACMLFVYMAAFSFAYERIEAALGALILFATVQLTMMGIGVARSGDGMTWPIFAGSGLALAGLVELLLPDVGGDTVSIAGSATMGLAGIAWAGYSAHGGRNSSPLSATAGNFLYAVPMALALSLWNLDSLRLDWAGAGYAIASGALASGLGYVLWYEVLPMLGIMRAATAQLAVPVIALMAAGLFLGEQIGARQLLAECMVISGIALTLKSGLQASRPTPGDPGIAVSHRAPSADDSRHPQTPR